MERQDQIFIYCLFLNSSRIQKWTHLVGGVNIICNSGKIEADDLRDGN